MLRLISQVQPSSTKSGTPTHEGNFVPNGILSTVNNPQPEQQQQLQQHYGLLKTKALTIPDHQLKKFNNNINTNEFRQKYPHDDDPSEAYCLTRNNNNEVIIVKKKNKRTASSTFSPLPGFFPYYIPNQIKLPRTIVNSLTSTTTTTNDVEKDRQLQEVGPLVISKHHQANNNGPGPITNSSWNSFFKPRKVEKTVAFFLKSNSLFKFFNNADLKKMVGDLRIQMSTKGLCVFDHFLGAEKGRMVLNDVFNLYQKGCFANGRLESSSSSSSSSNLGLIRGDIIKWLDGDEDGCCNIKYLMEQIDATVMMCGVGEEFGGYTIKQRTRAMVACYPGNGTRYLRHIDNPCQNGRVLTCIYYLNLNWDVRTDGGLLRIFPEGSRHEVANVAPIFDRMLFFWSDARNPHEVKPAYRERFAITLWYYDERQQINWDRKRQAQEEGLQSTSPR